MKLAKISKKPTIKTLDTIIKANKVTPKKATNINKQIRRLFTEVYPDTLATLERNALEMTPEDYIRARSYLSSLEPIKKFYK